MGKLLVGVLVVLGTVSIGIGVLQYHHNKHHVKVTSTRRIILLPRTPLGATQQPPTLNRKVIKHLRIPTEQVVLLVGEVGSDTGNVASEITTKALNGNPLYLLINSPGGGVLEGGQIISAIESVNVPVYTVCMQFCASMAAFIHQYGTKRFMVDRSFLMFHDAAGQVQGYFPHMQAQLNMIVRFVLKFDVYIANKAGMKLEDLTNMQSKNIWIDAEDALGKFNDKLVYVDVVSDEGKSLDMKSLLKLPEKPNKTKQDPTVPPSLFDVTL